MSVPMPHLIHPHNIELHLSSYSNISASRLVVFLDSCKMPTGTNPPFALNMDIASFAIGPYFSSNFQSRCSTLFIFLTVLKILRNFLYLKYSILNPPILSRLPLSLRSGHCLRQSGFPTCCSQPLCLSLRACLPAPHTPRR